MSRAFITERDGDDFEELPDKLISEHRNLVTAKGLKAIDKEVGRLESDLADAQNSGDRERIAAAKRDLRYWAQRQTSAEVIPKPAATDRVQFGSTVTLEREKARRQSYQIVGEDEADPAKGTLSYVSPLAQALMGKAVGDTVTAGAAEFEIQSIS